MANDLNQCNFIGRLGQDPDMRAMPSGKSVANFSIACGRKWRDKQTGEQKEETEWVRISAFDKLADIIGQYVKKGQQVYVSGRMRTRQYEKDGVTRYTTEIIADQLQMLGGKSDAASGSRPAPSNAPQVDDFEDDLPF